MLKFSASTVLLPIASVPYPTASQTGCEGVSLIVCLKFSPNSSSSSAEHSLITTDCCLRPICLLHHGFSLCLHQRSDLRDSFCCLEVTPFLLPPPHTHTWVLGFGFQEVLCITGLIWAFFSPIFGYLAIKNARPIPPFPHLFSLPS